MTTLRRVQLLSINSASSGFQQYPNIAAPLLFTSLILKLVPAQLVGSSSQDRNGEVPTFHQPTAENLHKLHIQGALHRPGQGNKRAQFFHRAQQTKSA